MFKLAFRNVLRNRRRSILTGLSITVAVMLVITLWSFVSGIADDLFNNYVSASTGHIRILNPEYLKRESMLPLGKNIADYDPIISMVEKNPDVKLATARIKFGVLMESKGKNKPIIGIGIDPIKEDKVLKLSQKMVIGRTISLGKKEVNVGAKMAEELDLKIGDTLTVITQTSGGSLSGINLKIVGIFSLGVGAIDRRTFYMPLDQAQELLDLSGKVTEIFILLKDPDKARQVASSIGKDIPKGYTIRPWQDVSMLYYFMAIIKYIYAFIYAFLLILASFTILNTMFMAVMERTREIGMMKSLGMRNGEMVRLIILEAMVLGIMASFVGAVLGTLLSYYISTAGVDYTAVFAKMGNVELPLSNIYHGLFKWTYILTGFLFGVFFSVLAAVPPALRAAKMEPVEALRG